MKRPGRLPAGSPCPPTAAVNRRYGTLPTVARLRNRRCRVVGTLRAVSLTHRHDSAPGGLRTCARHRRSRSAADGCQGGVPDHLARTVYTRHLILALRVHVCLSFAIWPGWPSHLPCSQVQGWPAATASRPHSPPLPPHHSRCDALTPPSGKGKTSVQGVGGGKTIARRSVGCIVPNSSPPVTSFFSHRL